MALHRIRWRLQQRRQGSFLRQGLAPQGQVGQQPAHGCGAAGAAGVELADAVAGEAELLLEQLLVFSGNRAGEAHAGRPGGDQLGGFGESLGPLRRRGRAGAPRAGALGGWCCLRLIAQARPDQFAHKAIAEPVGEHRLQQRATEGEGIEGGGGNHGRSPKKRRMAPMIALSHAVSRSGKGTGREAAAGAEDASPSSQPASSRVNNALKVQVRPTDIRAVEGAGNALAASPHAAVGSGPLRLVGNGIDRQLHCRVLQSPLAGVSDRIFRNLVRRWAPDALLFTEMVNATGLELGHGRSKLDDLADERGPIAVQLFDHRPAAMAEAARRAEACGAFLIDINMGCPVPKIARKGGGSGLLRDPELAMRVVAAVAAAVRIPVTVKTRLGWCGASADPVGFALGLENAGARALTLHGRTREQGFHGQADWTAIARVKQALTIPLIANGDVRSPEDALSCLALTGADGVMVGRGTMGAPWLVGRIDAALRGLPLPPIPGAHQRLALAAEQLDALVEAWGDKGLLIARKHLGWTCQGFAGAAELRHGLMRAPTRDDALKLLAQAAAGLGAREG